MQRHFVSVSRKLIKLVPILKRHEANLNSLIREVKLRITLLDTSYLNLSSAMLNDADALTYSRATCYFIS